MHATSAIRRWLRHQSDTAALGLVLAIISAADWLTSRDDPEHVGLLDTPPGFWRHLSGAALVLLAAVVASAVFATPAQAEAAFGLHLGTAHFGGPGAASMHSNTPGAYLRLDSGLTLGAYRNSEGAPSVYVARTWSTASGTWAITAGAVTGYASARLSPLLVPSVRLPLGQIGSGTSPGHATALRIALLPKPRATGAWGVHAALEVSL